MYNTNSQTPSRHGQPHDPSDLTRLSRIPNLTRGGNDAVMLQEFNMNEILNTVSLSFTYSPVVLTFEVTGSLECGEGVLRG